MSLEHSVGYKKDPKYKDVYTTDANKNTEKPRICEGIAAVVGYLTGLAAGFMTKDTFALVSLPIFGAYAGAKTIKIIGVCGKKRKKRREDIYYGGSRCYRVGNDIAALYQTWFDIVENDLDHAESQRKTLKIFYKEAKKRGKTFKPEEVERFKRL